MENKLSMIVALFCNPGSEDLFEQFESAAASIMRRYLGSIERRVRIAPNVENSSPYEVHLVTFPDEHAFDRYRADPDLIALADLRARAIHKTIVWRGSQLPNW